ncbi:MAG: RNA polymerase factor sigma-32 [Alphaproteobacteria bacterium]|jgi:RNA polymerase sigma-32 factor|nr:RNA polymerase factor sigma-32 [Rhodospirillaceae bacterium]MDP6405643.1 RNA polymerase factor sigma-32 [Alphaproteobacteria bacterium]MDP6621049.1 RNA polymerase factor sigma-32 [Alphaproteobacteria bacterium]|tara:strand:+ start:1567 stop:2451 length:885 start_codon:yes stop_codon:yes gene_type:complete
MGYIDTPQTQQANRRFIKAAMSIPLLQRDRELELARLWREEDDRKALHDLVSPYLRLVVSTASRFRSYGLPIGDLLQEGNVGLMQAAARFEPERQVRFSTYASWWIRSSMQEFILRNWSIVRTGTTAAQKSLFFNLRRLRARIDGSGEYLNATGKQFIADQLRVPLRDVEIMEARLTGHDKSLNATVGENGDSEFQDLLPAQGPGPEELVTEARDAATRALWLSDAVAELTPREQTIIRERRLQEDSPTLEALGSRLGISKERVRQIEQEALAKLKTTISERVGDPVAVGLVAG